MNIKLERIWKETVVGSISNNSHASMWKVLGTFGQDISGPRKYMTPGPNEYETLVTRLSPQKELWENNVSNRISK